MEQLPTTAGGRFIRRILEDTAADKGIDLDTRRGVVAIGDYASSLLSQKRRRVDEPLRMGREQLFTDIIKTLFLLDQNAVQNWPSNTGEPCAATEFAMAFIQIVVDRTRERLPSPSRRAQRWMADLLNKDHRALLEALRKERKWQREHGFLHPQEIKSELTPGATYLW